MKLKLITTALTAVFCISATVSGEGMMQIPDIIEDDQIDPESGLGAMSGIHRRMKRVHSKYCLQYREVKKTMCSYMTNINKNTKEYKMMKVCIQMSVLSVNYSQFVKNASDKAPYSAPSYWQTPARFEKSSPNSWTSQYPTSWKQKKSKNKCPFKNKHNKHHQRMGGDWSAIRHQQHLIAVQHAYAQHLFNLNHLNYMRCLESRLNCMQRIKLNSHRGSH